MPDSPEEAPKHKERLEPPLSNADMPKRKKRVQSKVTEIAKQIVTGRKSNRPVHEVEEGFLFTNTPLKSFAILRAERGYHQEHVESLGRKLSCIHEERVVVNDNITYNYRIHERSEEVNAAKRVDSWRADVPTRGIARGRSSSSSPTGPARSSRRLRSSHKS